MDANTAVDDTLHDDTTSPEASGFTRHSMTLSPMSSEESIREDAASVIPRVPLPGETLDASIEMHSYSTDHSTQNLDELTAEDIRENY